MADQDRRIPTPKELKDNLQVIKKEHDACLQSANDLLEAMDTRSKLFTNLETAQYKQFELSRYARAEAFQLKEDAEQAVAKQRIRKLQDALNVSMEEGVQSAISSSEIEDEIKAESDRSALAKANMELVEAIHASAEMTHNARVMLRRQQMEDETISALELKKIGDAVTTLYLIAKKRVEKCCEKST